MSLCDLIREETEVERRWNDFIQSRSTAPPPPDPAPVAASTMPLEDPFADDEPQGVPDPMRGWME